MTLTEFLLARIAEDEAAARAAVDSDGERWAAAGLRYDEEFDASVVLDRSEVHVAHAEEPAATHIARHDPARVLAECEAKRRIVAAFERAESGGSDYEKGYGLNVALRYLAAMYADRADYHNEWKP